MAKEYVLVGNNHMSRDKDGMPVEHKKGDILTLTDVQAAAFGDKFKAKEVVDAEVAAMAALVAAKANPGEKDPATTTTTTKA
jgi:hypothetical protein